MWTWSRRPSARAVHPATVPGTGGAVVESTRITARPRLFRAALRFEPSDWLAIQPAVYYQRSTRQTSDLFDLSLSKS